MKEFMEKFGIILKDEQQAKVVTSITDKTHHVCPIAPYVGAEVNVRAPRLDDLESSDLVPATIENREFLRIQGFQDQPQVNLGDVLGPNILPRLLDKLEKAGLQTSSTLMKFTKEKDLVNFLSGHELIDFAEAQAPAHWFTAKGNYGSCDEMRRFFVVTTYFNVMF